MLNTINYRKVKFGVVGPRQITGRNLAHSARSARQRAVLGAELLEGSTVLVQPTLLQVTELVSVCAPYIRAAHRMRPEDRRLVEAGVRPLFPPKMVALISDEQLDQLARIDGGARLWAALERAEARDRRDRHFIAA